MPCLLKLELLKVTYLLLGTVGQKMTIRCCHGVEVALEYIALLVLQSCLQLCGLCSGFQASHSPTPKFLFVLLNPPRPGKQDAGSSQGPRYSLTQQFKLLFSDFAEMDAEGCLLHQHCQTSENLS